MKDLAIELPNRPGALADMGEALGRAGVNIEGGGAWVVDGRGAAHFLFSDGAAAKRALEGAGIKVLAEREVIVQRLRQGVAGQLGMLTRRMAEAGVNIEAQYSDHDHQLILVVDDPVRGRKVSEAWAREISDAAAPRASPSAETTTGESHGTQASEAALARAYEGARAYLKTTRDQSTYVPITQAEVRKRLGTILPNRGEPSEKVIESLIKASDGAFAPTMGGRFFAYVIGGTHPAGVAAEFLNAAWDDKPGTPLVSPFGCAIDGLVGEWVLELLDLPRASSVGIVTGASLGNFLCIAAARHALLKREGWDVEAQGLYGAPTIHVLISEEAHPTVHKSLRLAGLGAKRTIVIETNAQGAMRTDRLAAALRSVKGPVLVSSQAGNINTGAMDPYAEIGPLCRERGAWLHVDGAFGLWARVSPELADSIRGVELADSWATDAHKMLNTPYDAGFGIVRDAAAHVGAMDISATYLVQAEGARDPSRFVPELSRRARGTPIYATIRALGREGVREMIEGCCANARRMRELITKQPGITCLNDVVFNQAIFRFAAPGEAGSDAAGDALTTKVATRVRESGECWVQSSQWRGRTVMRFSVADRATTPADVDRAAAAVLKAYDEETRT